MFNSALTTVANQLKNIYNVITFEEMLKNISHLNPEESISLKNDLCQGVIPFYNFLAKQFNCKGKPVALLYVTTNNDNLWTILAENYYGWLVVTDCGEILREHTFTYRFNHINASLLSATQLYNYTQAEIQAHNFNTYAESEAFWENYKKSDTSITKTLNNVPISPWGPADLQYCLCNYKRLLKK